MDLGSRPRSRPPSQYSTERELVIEKLILNIERATQQVEWIRRFTLMTVCVAFPLFFSTAFLGMNVPYIHSPKTFICTYLTNVLVTIGTIKWSLVEQKMQTWTKVAQNSFSNISESIPSFEHVLRYMLLTLLVATVVKMSMRHIVALASRYGIDERLTAWSSGFKKTLQEFVLDYWEITRSIAARRFHSKPYAAVVFRLFILQTTHLKKDSRQSSPVEGSKPNQESVFQSASVLFPSSSGPGPPGRSSSSPTVSIDDLLRGIPPDKLKDRCDSRACGSKPVGANQTDDSTPNGAPRPKEILDESGSESASSSSSTSSTRASNLGAKASNSYESSSSAVRKRSRTSAPGDQRSQKDNDEDEDEDNWERPRKKKDRSPEADSAVLKRLKCPYYQREPAKHPRSSCSGRGFADMAKLKDHLKRVHVMPPHCKRCWVELRSEKELEEHVRQESVCMTQPKPDDNRMSLQQLQSLNFNRAPFAHAKSVKEKWGKLYQIIFPNDRIIPSPYEEFGLSPRFCGILAQLLSEEMAITLGQSHADAIQRMSDKLPALISESKQRARRALSPCEVVTTPGSDNVVEPGKASDKLQLPSFEYQQYQTTCDLPACSGDDAFQFNTTDQWNDFDINDLLNDISDQSILSNNEAASVPGLASDPLNSLADPPEINEALYPLHMWVLGPTHQSQAELSSGSSKSSRFDPSFRPNASASQIDREMQLQDYCNLDHGPDFDINFNAGVDQTQLASTNEGRLSGMERRLERFLEGMSPTSGMVMLK